MKIGRKEISEIKEAAGEFYKDALEARKEYLVLRLKQDAEIRNIFVRSADRIAEEIRKGGKTTLREQQLQEIEAQLRKEAALINGELTDKISGYVEKGVSASSNYSQSVLIGMLDKAGEFQDITKAGVEQMYFRVNREAVQAVWDRTHKGLKLSDKIWNTSQQTSGVMANIVQDAVARGQDAVTTARLLEQYVLKGANELTKHYEGMMKRMKGRIPGNISYQALRLARTETTAAFGQGTIKSAQASPSTVGIKYSLSSAHVVVDICDILAAEDVGLGPGVYSMDDPPPYPAHPNTTSFLVEVVKDPDEFAKELKQWVEDPDSQPEINNWYENVYKPEAESDTISGTARIVPADKKDATPVPSGGKFKPAANIKKAERFAIDNNLADIADYAGIDLEVANEWNQGIYNTLSQFPELRENIQFIGTTQARNKYALRKYNISLGKISPRSLAVSLTDPKTKKYGINGVTINKLYGKDTKDLKDILEYGVKSKHSPVGCGTVKAVIDHELGHQLDTLLDISSQENIINLYLNSTKAELSNGLSSYTWNNRNRNKIREFVAEGWAEYNNNPTPRPMALEIGRTVERRYAEWQKINR